VAGLISMYSSHDKTRLESLGDGGGFNCTFGYVSGWGIGSSLSLESSASLSSSHTMFFYNFCIVMKISLFKDID
jgi:hypothetical protein